ncbi:hypothetical protein ACV4JM_002368 [Salmonella enterica subsp. enterica serovar Altona]|nr:hypothetical protein [Salmonella enterica subsp. enterica serovar Emek]EEP6459501.1 hypothetical protein [Salmonella enterica subsp. enterica serovar Altona]EFZ9051865.1 hypothetical protein [Salmonella enterica]EDW4567630.1 hypothetical protein [Salmonella enterica subsp. enterica serovar Emek]EED8584827.1 hypothetical protein [Salmonella enterica subsp. enterica serovar Emek]
MMKPIIHWHDGKYVCYREKDMMYIDFPRGYGVTPTAAYLDWERKITT